MRLSAFLLLLLTEGGGCLTLLLTLPAGDLFYHVCLDIGLGELSLGNHAAIPPHLLPSEEARV